MTRILVFLILSCLISCRVESPEIKKPNVLLIFCDDLNDSVEGFGGHPQAMTPNLDRLAQEGIRFTNAHSADPICGPSRASFLTGIYPHHSGLYGYNQNQNAWNNNPVLKNCRNIFEQFSEQGYTVYAAGKLFHHNAPLERYLNSEEVEGEFGPGLEYGPFAWNGAHSGNLYNNMPAHPDVRGKFGRSGFTSFASLDNVPTVPPDPDGAYPGYTGWYLVNWPDGKPFRYVSETDRDPMPDELTADFAIEKLRLDHQNPFFMAIGIVRPHSPWHAPKEYFELFPLDKVKHPPYLENDLDDCAEELHYQYYWPGIHRFRDLVDGYDGDEGWRRFLQAYLACVAFADAQVGRILDELARSPYAENTIVVFTSDHGYHMGEKDQLFKHTVWEESTRVPMIIRLPGGKHRGMECRSPVSLIDVYPTLLDLCGLSDSTLKNEHGHPLGGYSMRPFLDDPVNGNWEGPDVALSCIDAGVPVEKDVPGLVKDQHFAVRSRDWRYVLTRSGAEELYDHRNDPNEWKNLAGDPEYAAIQSELRSTLLEMTGRDPGTD